MGLVAASASGFAGLGEFPIDAADGARHGDGQVAGGGACTQVCEPPSSQIRRAVKVVSRPASVGNDAGSGQIPADMKFGRDNQPQVPCFHGVPRARPRASIRPQAAVPRSLVG